MTQETLEEAKYRVYKDYWNEYHTQHTKSNFLTAFKLGAKWQQERSYSEVELKEAFMVGHNICRCITDNRDEAKEYFREWFNIFKKK